MPDLPGGTETGERCPSCGCEPDDDTLHREGCERIDTCGQMGPPWLDPPWHPEPEDGFTSEACYRHREQVHGVRGRVW